MLDDIETTPDSLASRLEGVLKVMGGFKSTMNRSFLIVALFEAKRCLTPRFPSMLPFERNIALISTAMDLVYTLDFLSDEQKAGIVSLTVKKAEKPCIAKITFANRNKLIREQFLPGIEKLLSEEKTHEEICDEFVQRMYEEKTGKNGAHPPLWEYKNIPSFLVYRVYYRKLEMDQSIFAPIAPREVNIPAVKPDEVWQYAIRSWSPIDGSDGKVSDPNSAQCGKTIARGCGANNANKTLKMNHKRRLELIMEVKIRLKLLAEMEGIFPDQRMKKELKRLFFALPPALTASEVKNRQAAIMEAQLRIELLKKMKSAIPGRFASEMRKSFMGLPPLPKYGTASNKTRMEVSKKPEHTKDVKDEMNEEGGWETVNDMEDVNIAVDGMEIV